MKIYRFTHEDGELDFVAANRITEAIHQLYISKQVEIHELTETEVDKISSKKWDSLYINEDGKTLDTLDGKTFSDWMLENNEPGYIAGTID